MVQEATSIGGVSAAVMLEREREREAASGACLGRYAHHTHRLSP